MENRQIMVANTKTQKRDVVTTNASTLGELKAALAEKGIDYSGMTFTEGISKITLNDDSSPLPTNVMYKGQPTNNLVILLTNTKKNINSGAGTRQEAYAYIKENHLQDSVVDVFGKNFTQVKTDDLWDFINKTVNHTEENDEDLYNDDCCNDENDEDEEDDDTEDCEDISTITYVLIDHINAFREDGLIDEDDVRYIIDSLSASLKPVQKPVFMKAGNETITDTDVDEMIAGMV